MLGALLFMVGRWQEYRRYPSVEEIVHIVTQTWIQSRHPCKNIINVELFSHGAGLIILA
jgi:hypothetical protein